MCGQVHLVVRIGDGSNLRIPRAWTDADGAPAPADPERNAVFTLEAIRALIKVVDVLRSRD